MDPLTRSFFCTSFNLLEFVDSSTTTHSGSNVNLSIPGTLNTGNLLMLFVSHGGGSSTVTTPTGWTEMTTGGEASDPLIDSFYRIHDGSSTVTVPIIGSNGAVVLVGFKYQKITSITNIQGPTNGSVASLTTTQNNSWGIHVTQLNDVGTPALSTGFTQIALETGGRAIRVSRTTNYQTASSTVNPSTSASTETLYEIY